MKANKFGSRGARFHPPPRKWRQKAYVPVLTARFCARAIFHGTKKSLQTNKGRRSAERRILRDRSAQSERCRWAGSRRALLLGDALAFRRSTAALADCSAQSGPALHGSANGCDSVRHPGSQLLADLRRGRPGEFPNRPRTRLRAPSRAPLPLASIGRHRLTSLGRAGRSLLVRWVVWIQEISAGYAISLMRRDSFFVVCLIRRRANCGIAAMIRTFQLRLGGYWHFLFVTASQLHFLRFLIRGIWTVILRWPGSGPRRMRPERPGRTPLGDGNESVGWAERSEAHVDFSRLSECMGTAHRAFAYAPLANFPRVLLCPDRSESRQPC